MTTIAEAIGAAAVDETKGLVNGIEMEPEPERRGFDFMALLKAETGPGSVDEYVDHPLNFAKSKGLAQVLRGLTGIFGELRYAVIDVIVGALQFGKERAANAHTVRE